MTKSTDLNQLTEFRCHLINAYINWLTENGYKTHLSVKGSAITLPALQRYIKDGRIVLNVTPGAVENFVCTEGRISFSCRFNSVAHHLDFSVRDVVTIYGPEINFGVDLSVIGFQDEILKSTLRSNVPSTHQSGDAGNNVKQLKPALKIVK